ncbi:phage tail tape measure protein [Pseudomonas guariconensis]|uniref:phage tail tape measure protein n=1 Tax=Pseudomonas guariconensis TaxID=1288410 RepID=UPI0018A8C0C0|nr:phage tail tape measure protein [Pseudomonas guariconensis]MBF8728849.1 phage tail tape measure protein [Pseudomonas guariconensis]
MASRSLGTLTLDLIAKIGGFTGPMDKASRESQKRMAEIKKSAENLGKAFGASLAGVPTIITGLVTSSALAAKQITNLSNLAGLSTTDFQRYAAAAASVGVEQDKLSDIFKDTNDKVGDFLATGGGELKNFFDTVAPKVGVTAEQFRNLNSADALQLYVTSLQKANVSQAQMTFFMEAIADEATALVPLLANGGKAFRELGASAEAAGMIMDEQTIGSAKQFSAELTVLGQYASSARTALAAEFMPVLAQLAKDLSSTTKEAGGLRNVVRELSDDLIEATAVTASLGDGLARGFTITAGVIASGFATTLAYMQSLGATGKSILGSITFGDMSKNFKEEAAKLSSDAIINSRTAGLISAELAKEFEKPWAGDAIRQYVIEARKAAAELPKISPPASGKPGFVGQTDAQKAAAKASEAAAKKINDAFASTEENYRRQIELINTSTDKRKSATEVEKLAFETSSGKLVGLNSLQRKRLENLAAELDALIKVRQAEEDANKLAAFRASVNEDYLTAKSGFDQELAGAGMGEKYKERLKERLAIEEDFNRQQRELVLQRNTGDLAPELYEQETQVLRDALEQRLALQEDYYSRVDAAQLNWVDGAKDAWADFYDNANDLAGQARDAFSTAFSGMTDSLVGFVKTGKLSFSDLMSTFADTALRMLIQWGMAQVAMAALNAFTSTAAIPIVGPLAAPAAAASSMGQAGSFMSTISAVAGMAHDGMDYIPREGTWLLDKGERVVDRRTNADLKDFLASSSKPEGKPARGDINLSFNVSVQAQPGMSDAEARRQGQQMMEGSADFVRQVIQDEMRPGGLLA